MGDLIIKPESGGSIKLQNNAGTNALVSDNSGNVTLAGNTTLSGTANNIGTVTAGNLSNSNIVYPAGHVIQVVENNHLPTVQVFDTDIDTVISVTITNVLASSICIIWAGATFRCQNTGDYNGGEIYIYRGETNLLAGIGGNTDSMGFAYSNEPTSEFYWPVLHVLKDPTPGTGSNTYSLRASGYASHNMNITHDGQKQICVMEVAQ